MGPSQLSQKQMKLHDPYDPTLYKYVNAYNLYYGLQDHKQANNLWSVAVRISYVHCRVSLSRATAFQKITSAIWVWAHNRLGLCSPQAS
jgi:hypothetical protein